MRWISSLSRRDLCIREVPLDLPRYKGAGFTGPDAACPADNTRTRRGPAGRSAAGLQPSDPELPALVSWSSRVSSGWVP